MNIIVSNESFNALRKAEASGLQGEQRLEKSKKEYVNLVESGNSGDIEKTLKKLLEFSPNCEKSHLPDLKKSRDIEKANNELVKAYISGDIRKIVFAKLKLDNLNRPETPKNPEGFRAAKEVDYAQRQYVKAIRGGDFAEIAKAKLEYKQALEKEKALSLCELRSKSKYHKLEKMFKMLVNFFKSFI